MGNTSTLISWFCCQCLSLYSSPLAHAQTGAGRGLLLDASGGQPILFASVVLRLPNSTALANAQATEAARFALEKLRLGTCVLRANVLGYRSGRRALSLTSAVPVV
jgi:hypothetical protein